MSKNIGFDKSFYRAFAASGAALPLFFQPWWLDLVCKKKWEVLYYQEAGRVVAVYTYFPKRKWGFHYVTMPDLTRFMGPYFLEEMGERKLQKISMKLIKTLAPYDGVEQTLHYQIVDWLPFSWSGFAQTSRYSYVLRNILQLDQVLAGMSTDYRNNKLKKSAMHLSFEVGQELEEAWECFEAPFKRKSMVVPMRHKFFQRLLNGVRERGAGEIFVMRNDQQEAIANGLVVWQEKTSYLLLLGESPAGRSGYAGVGLIWNIIQHLAQEKGIEEFDFMGSMDEGIARVRQNFGATQKVYFSVKREKAMLAMVRRLSRR
ncbi:MAG: GNAT family N-acetyltransferase [Saprospiraceae bacterium]|nr:GNAT family N-acetyltransferase [Saprospiraceae bacterium]